MLDQFSRSIDRESGGVCSAYCKISCLFYRVEFASKLHKCDYYLKLQQLDLVCDVRRAKQLCSSNVGFVFKICRLREWWSFICPLLDVMSVDLVEFGLKLPKCHYYLKLLRIDLVCDVRRTKQSCSKNVGLVFQICRSRKWWSLLCALQDAVIVLST